MPKPKVLILTGSKHDLELLKPTEEILKQFNIPYEIKVSSAHRNPGRTRKLASQAEERGIRVIIAAAGMAAHLAGVIASLTPLPVIGIPLPGSYFKGIDSYLATLQMPVGTPVATVAVGSHGAKNAAILAAQILALSDHELKKRLQRFKAELAKK